MTGPQRGLRVTRRAVLRSSAVAPALFALHGCQRTQVSAPTASPAADGTAVFLERWATRALELASDDAPNEDRFVHELVGALATIERSTLPTRARTSYDSDGLRIGPVAGDETFQVLELELDPGAVVQPHNHVGYCFATLGMSGGALVQHFELASDAPTPGADLETPFLVREVSSIYLTAGRSTTLTRARANIHAFAAGPTGAKIIDFGVFLGEPGPGPKNFSVLDIDPLPSDPRTRVYGARWLGNIYARR